MEANIAFPAALIGDPTRAAILMALMDGSAQPASALAYVANVTPQSASNHLAKLMEGGMLAVEIQGRHRYYRLASPDIATVLEALANLAPCTRHLRQPLTPKGRALRFARSCYDHLAGQLGVAIVDALEARALISKGDPATKCYDLSEAGRRWFSDLGVDPDVKRRGRPLQALCCLDWTERRHHLGGTLGTAFFERICALGWLERNRETRAVQLTALGITAFHDLLNLDCRALQASQASGMGQSSSPIATRIANSKAEAQQAVIIN